MNRTAVVKFSVRGMTLAELAVAMGVLTLLGLLFFAVLNSGMILYAKNTAVNSAHEEARDGINRLTRDIHASISVPQLRTSNTALLLPSNISSIVSPTPASGATVAPMAAGVSFQNVSLGPQYIWKEPSGGKIMVKGTPDTPEAPSEGMRLVAPLFGVEDDITQVSASSSQAGHHNIWLADPNTETLLSNKAQFYGTSGNTYSIVYYTYRVLYLVKNGTYIPDANGPFTITTATASATDERYALSGSSYVPSATGTYKITPAVYTTGTAQRYRYEKGELHLYRQQYANNAFYWADKAVVARYVSNPTPFYIPLVASASGPWYESTNSYAGYTSTAAQGTGNRFLNSADSRYVGVKLTVRDPSSSNRGYLATASLLNTQIDYRSRLAISQ
jgi:hypothetical protein